MIRVAVAGALGRMGRIARAALRDLPDISYAGGFARTSAPEDQIFDDFERVLELKPDVLLDLTTQPVSSDISTRAVVHGVRPVVGATGWSAQERDALSTLAAERGIGAMIVPNFSIGAMLMMRFAQQAARFFPTVEIVELHHDKKLDKPSGTAKLTAEQIAAAGPVKDVPDSQRPVTWAARASRGVFRCRRRGVDDPSRYIESRMLRTRHTCGDPRRNANAGPRRRIGFDLR